MSGYRLLKHHSYDDSAAHLPPAIRRKATWSQVLLGARGRTPSVKSTTGYNHRWRRTPVQGYHYYLWWIPLSESVLAETTVNDEPGHTILVHSIRHHDETDDPIDLRSLDEFEELPVASLDPRFDEQREVSYLLSRRRVSVATIKGLPGSGKTVSLFYLVRDLAGRGDLGNVLYLTYTSRLRRAARDFLQAQNLDLEGRIHLRTYHELLGDLLRSQMPHADPFADLRDFTRFLETQHPATVGPWRRYPQTFYTELRAYLFGRALPAGYTPSDDAILADFFPGGAVRPEDYARRRDLDLPLAESAVKLADRLRDSHFFLDQRLAAKALAQLTPQRLPAWLRNVDAIIVDEVQDLTMLQQLLVAEVAHARLQRQPDAPLVLAVAGDESQIVQPSGFDWGESKDLLRAVLQEDPAEFEFRHQRRSPRNLARVIDNAWAFYAHLPKELRPSANRQSFIDDGGVTLAQSHAATGEEHGRLLICPLPEDALPLAGAGLKRWRSLAAELTNLPGRAIVDLTEQLLPALATPDDAAIARADEVIFLAREIKGLERNTVLVHGLNETYQRAVRLADEVASNLPHLEARRLFDTMRVALSRSTDKLILLDAPTAPVLAALGFGDPASLEGYHVITWESLLDLLHTEEMSEIEVVEGLLDEVDDLLERGRWEQARRRNRRAYDFAVQMEDRALAREAEDQYIRSFLHEAEALLATGDLRGAISLNQSALALAEAHGDPELLADVEDQQRQQQAAAAGLLAQALEQARQTAASDGDGAAYAQLRALAGTVIAAGDARLSAQVDEALLAYGWQWGVTLAGQRAPRVGQLSALFEELTAVLQRQGDETGQQLASIVAARYAEIPPGGDEPAASRRLVSAVQRYLRAVAPLRPDSRALALPLLWLEEAFVRLNSHYDDYYGWALAAQEYTSLAPYAALDEHLWDLENRVELAFGRRWKTEAESEQLLRFAAFIAAYNEEPATASLAWEKLGQVELAITQARLAGDLERAFHLLRKTGAAIPEELSVAVKLARLAEQLRTKQDRLTPAERRRLAGQLAALTGELAAPDDEARL
jgi:hypothetical protein